MATRLPCRTTNRQERDNVRMKKQLIALALLALAPLAHAATKYPVYVMCQANVDDTTRKRLCSDLRDVVARSPRYELLASEPANTFYFILNVTSLKEDKTEDSS